MSTAWGAAELSDLGREREGTTACNSAPLGLAGPIGSQLPARRPAPRRTYYTVNPRDWKGNEGCTEEAPEPRRSGRISGASQPQYSLDQASLELDKAEAMLTRQPRAERKPSSPSAGPGAGRRGFHGTAAGVHQLRMAPLYTADGRLLPRRWSCHVRTQCFVSWCGSSCPLVCCSRCLANILGQSYVEVQEMLLRANGTEDGSGWQCFKCRPLCACRAPKCPRASGRGLPAARPRLPRDQLRGACTVLRPPALYP